MIIKHCQWILRVRKLLDWGPKIHTYSHKTLKVSTLTLFYSSLSKRMYNAFCYWMWSLLNEPQILLYVLYYCTMLCHNMKILFPCHGTIISRHCVWKQPLTIVLFPITFVNLNVNRNNKDILSAVVSRFKVKWSPQVLMSC